jgi:hypothetical protein
MQMTTARTGLLTRSTHLSRRSGLALAALVVATGLAAIGAISSHAATAATTALSPNDKVLIDYAKCMRGKGVAIPDPIKGKDGKYAFPAISKSITGAAGVREKAQSCASKATGNGAPATSGNGQPAGFGGRGGFGAAQTPAQQAALKKFQDCLKQNGVTLGNRPGGRPPATTAKAKVPTTTTKGGKIVKPVIAGNGPDANDDGAGPGGGRGGRGFGGGGFGDPKTQAAFQKCQALLPATRGNAG